MQDSAAGPRATMVCWDGPHTMVHCPCMWLKASPSLVNQRWDWVRWDWVRWDLRKGTLLLCSPSHFHSRSQSCSLSCSSFSSCSCSCSHSCSCSGSSSCSCSHSLSCSCSSSCPGFYFCSCSCASGITENSAERSQPCLCGAGLSHSPSSFLQSVL